MRLCSGLWYVALLWSVHARCFHECLDQMIGDGLCNLECMEPSCQFDAVLDEISDCVKDCEGTGCNVSNLGNQECDPECNSQVCGWDMGDCICSTNCQIGDINNSICNTPCLVPNCNFDMNDCEHEQLEKAISWQALSKDYESEFDFDLCSENSKCFYDMIGDGTCQSECYVKECLYDLGDCKSCPESCSVCLNGVCLDCKEQMRLYDKCVDECPYSHIRHDIYDNICYPKEDTSTRSNPYPMYVKSDIPYSQDQIGTFDNPFTDLGTALRSIWTKYTIIHLQSEVIYLSSVPIHSTIIYSEDSLSPLESTLRYTLVEISSYICEESNCLSEPAIIKIYDPNLKLVLAENAVLIIENVILDGSESLVRGCESWYCYYCPYYYTDKTTGLDYDDKHNIVDTSKWAKNCQNFNDHNFIYLSLYSKLILKVNHI